MDPTIFLVIGLLIFFAILSVGAMILAATFLK